MAVSPAKENILKKIRQALAHPVPLPFPHSEGAQPVFTPENDDHAVTFAREFTRLQGKFAYCNNMQELKNAILQLMKEKNWEKIFIQETGIRELLSEIIIPHPNLADCDFSLTSCECLVARTGSIVISAGQSGRTPSVYAPVHICIAFADQVVYDIRDALSYLKGKYNNKLPSMITFATGPSRTADIEKTLVTGVHGPKEVYCFLVENNP